MFGEDGLPNHNSNDRGGAGGGLVGTSAPRYAKPSSREEIDKYLRDVSRCGPPLVEAHEKLAHCIEPYRYVRRWLDRLSPAAVAARTWTIVNVGANKGYAMASVLDGLGVAGYTMSGLAETLYRYAAHEIHLHDSCHHQLCGDCCECLGDGAEAAARQKGLDASRRPLNWIAFAYEPNAANYKFLKYYFDASGDRPLLQGAPDGRHTSNNAYDEPTAAAANPADAGGVDAATGTNMVHVEQAFVGNFDGSVDFPDCGLGAEDCRVQSHPGRGSGPDQKFVDLRFKSGEYVPASRRRGAVRASKLQSVLPADIRYIDVLITDAEGNDYAVADGLAGRFFDKAAIGLYVFEIPPHGDRTLKNQLRRLEAAGYVCYAVLAHAAAAHAPAAGRSVMRLSHGCTSKDRRTLLDHAKPGHNIACVSRRERHLMDVFMALEGEAPGDQSAGGGGMHHATCEPLAASKTFYEGLRRQKLGGMRRRLPNYVNCSGADLAVDAPSS